MWFFSVCCGVLGMVVGSGCSWGVCFGLVLYGCRVVLSFVSQMLSWLVLVGCFFSVCVGLVFCCFSSLA